MAVAFGKGASRFRERARARLAGIAERFFAIPAFHEDVSAVANADHDRLVACEVQRLSCWHRALDVLPAVNDDAHPDRSENSQFDRDSTNDWTRRRRL